MKEKKWCSHDTWRKPGDEHFCTFYSSMSDRGKLLRKRFHVEDCEGEELGAHYMWTRICESCQRPDKIDVNCLACRHELGF